MAKRKKDVDELDVIHDAENPKMRDALGRLVVASLREDGDAIERAESALARSLAETSGRALATRTALSWAAESSGLCSRTRAAAAAATAAAALEPVTVAYGGSARPGWRYCCLCVFQALPRRLGTTRALDLHFTTAFR